MEYFAVKKCNLITLNLGTDFVVGTIANVWLSKVMVRVIEITFAEFFEIFTLIQDVRFDELSHNISEKLMEIIM